MESDTFHLSGLTWRGEEILRLRERERGAWLEKEHASFENQPLPSDSDSSSTTESGTIMGCPCKQMKFKGRQ